jgi:hypothetical protein
MAGRQVDEKRVLTRLLNDKDDTIQELGAAVNEKDATILGLRAEVEVWCSSALSYLDVLVDPCFGR